jgi:phosphate acetyltransferase
MSSNPPIFDASDAYVAPLVRYLRRHPKRIVFPDGNDPRILRVAAELVRLEAVAPILLGRRGEIHATADSAGVKLDFIGVIEPEHSADFSLFCERYRKIGRYRRVKVADPGEVMAKPAYYGAMMLQYGYADGLVGGNLTLPSAFFRALFHMIKRMPGLDSAGSCLPVSLPLRTDLGTRGTLFLTDCAVIPAPTVSQLAMLAVETARVAGALLRATPRVAMISYSTRGSAQSASTQRVLAATSLARDRARQQLVSMDIDGELEVDAAIHPPAAARKAPNSILAGRANVLVFPDLNAAHSAWQLLELAAGAQPGGQLILGLARPAAQVSRGSSESSIFRAAIATALRSVAYRDLIQNES